MKELLLALCLGLVCTACVPRDTVPATVVAGKTHVTLTPETGPAFAGTYDFDILGDVQGDGCASFSGSANQFGNRKVLVNGQPQYYRVAIAGLLTTGVASAIEIQSEQAALFDALNKLQGADVIFVTRTRILPKSADEVCATVWGQVARLKKGPTIGGPSPETVAAEPPPPPPPPPAPAPPPAAPRR